MDFSFEFVAERARFSGRTQVKTRSRTPQWSWEDSGLAAGSAWAVLAIFLISWQSGGRGWFARLFYSNCAPGEGYFTQKAEGRVWGIQGFKNETSTARTWGAQQSFTVK
jgi:hypothetical protein